MLIILETCPICDGKEWENLDRLRERQVWYDMDYREMDEPVGFKICKTCGFLTYDYASDDRLKNHYTNSRPMVQINNLTVGIKKNNFHYKFLELDNPDSIINKRITPDSKILDVGCAIGSFLDLMQAKLGVKNLYGTEIVDGLKYYAKYHSDYHISETIDESIKYDMVAYYHVFEHMQYPDKELEKVNRILADDGLLYISIPIWFDRLENDAGEDPTQFEIIYHLNHVNCFSPQALKNILHKHGFEIIKEDRLIYGLTVLCKKISYDSIYFKDYKKEESYDIVKEDYKKIIEIVERHKKATELLKANEFEECLKVEPKYPIAYILYSIYKDNMKDFKKQIEILNRGLAENPDNSRVLLQLARVYFQWDENNPEKHGYYSNNIKMAERIFHKLNEIRPGNDEIFFLLGVIERLYKKDYIAAEHFFNMSMNLNPAKNKECFEQIAGCYLDRGRADDKAC